MNSQDEESPFRWRRSIDDVTEEFKLRNRRLIMSVIALVCLIMAVEVSILFYKKREIRKPIPPASPRQSEAATGDSSDLTIQRFNDSTRRKP